MLLIKEVEKHEECLGLHTVIDKLKKWLKSNI